MVGTRFPRIDKSNDKEIIPEIKNILKKLLR